MLVVQRRDWRRRVGLPATVSLVWLSYLQAVIRTLACRVTEAGEGEDGRMKSAIGIGALLMDGLGDTIRVSLTEDPELEMEPCRSGSCPESIRKQKPLCTRRASAALEILELSVMISGVFEAVKWDMQNKARGCKTQRAAVLQTISWSRAGRLQRELGCGALQEQYKRHHRFCKAQRPVAAAARRRRDRFPVHPAQGRLCALSSYIGGEFFLLSIAFSVFSLHAIHS